MSVQSDWPPPRLSVEHCSDILLMWVAPSCWCDETLSGLLPPLLVTLAACSCWDDTLSLLTLSELWLAGCWHDTLGLLVSSCFTYAEMLMLFGSRLSCRSQIADETIRVLEVGLVLVVWLVCWGWQDALMLLGLELVLSVCRCCSLRWCLWCGCRRRWWQRRRFTSPSDSHTCHVTTNKLSQIYKLIKVKVKVKSSTTLCLKKKHVTTFFAITWTMNVRL